MPGTYICRECGKNRHERCTEDGCACEICAADDSE